MFCEASAEPCHVLLVEDHPDTAALMCRILERRGYRVTVATSVAEALQAAQSQPFDLVISDLRLPDGSGHDLLRGLNRDDVTLPAVALSGYGTPDDLRGSREAGFVEHLTKPVDLDRFWATIERILASRAAA